MKPNEYRYIFGPVPSRRFGRSLGIDLTPHKTCSLDCVFCQLGRTASKTLKREVYVPTQEAIAEIDHWLANDGEADYLTLSGSGEPTLHAEVGQVLSYLREQPIPSVLLTNGTLLSLPRVREAAALARVVKLSLSAWDEASFQWINRPHPDLHFDPLLEGFRRFRDQFDGELWLEVFLLAGFNAMPERVEKIAALARSFSPDHIHLNTVARPPAEDFAAPVPAAELQRLIHMFDPPAVVAADCKPPRPAFIEANQARILSMLKRRPCTTGQIQASFGLHLNEVSKYLGQLMEQKQITASVRNHEVYYTASDGAA